MGSAVRVGSPPRRIFAGLTEICGYYGNVASGFRELGIEMAVVTLDRHPFEYGGEATHPLISFARFARERRQTTPRKNLAAKILWRLGDPVARAALLVWAILRFDVFFFSFGTSFFNQREFPILKALGKRIICVFHGTDERPPYLNGVVARPDDSGAMVACIRQSLTQKAMLRRSSSWADFVVSHPLSAHFQDRKAVSLLTIGLPQRKTLSALPSGNHASSRVRILHAPSRAESKGTAHIRQYIAQLRSEGLDIDYIEVIGRPHSEVLAEIAACDFVVDEVWSDSPLATLAAEAAAAGRPAVVGGYGWSDLRTLLGNSFPPSAACAPEEMAEAIRLLVTNIKVREDLGRHARAFVEAEWSCRRVAERYLQLLTNGGESGWFFDPKQVEYVLGYGMPKEMVRQSIRKTVEIGGSTALQVDDKPLLKRRMLSFAQLA